MGYLSVGDSRFPPLPPPFGGGGLCPFELVQTTSHSAPVRSDPRPAISMANSSRSRVLLALRSNLAPTVNQKRSSSTARGMYWMTT